MSSHYYLGVHCDDIRLATLVEALSALHSESDMPRYTLICCGTRDAFERVETHLKQHLPLEDAGLVSDPSSHRYRIFGLHADLVPSERDEILHSLYDTNPPSLPHFSLAPSSSRPLSDVPLSSSLPNHPRTSSPQEGHYSPRGAWHADDEEASAAHAALHATRLAQRRDILVTTDAALAKSIKFHSINLIVHYDLPLSAAALSKRLAVVAVSSAKRDAARITSHVYFAVAGRLAAFRHVEDLLREINSSATRIETIPTHLCDIFK